MIGQTISHFRITARIGEGGMGEVYRATDTRLSRDVAVKVLPEAFAQDTERLARFEREARVLAALSHPNIASIYGLEQDDNRSYLILELAEGESLSERLTTGPMSVPDALAAGLQIAQALEAAHEKGIIHRDLKPANIKISPGGQVKVLDFGLAKALEDQQARPEASLTHSPTVTGKMTSPGVLLGTAAYMSPEQVRGQPADRRSDVWAFGLVLYEMLSGNQAFAEPTLSDTLASVLRSEIDWKKLPPETPSSIRRLLRRCLERDVKRRLPEIGAARLELQESLEGRGDDSGASAAALPAGTPRASRLPWAIAAAAVLAAAVFAARAFRGGEKPRVLHTSLGPSPAEDFSLTTTGPGPPTLSRDGTKVAFGAVDPRGKIRLYVRALEASEAKALPGTDSAAYPFWSPDGRRIGFFADGKLKSIDAAGGPPVEICEARNGKGGAWNEAGDIVFAPLSSGPLFRVRAEGGKPTQWSNLDEARGDSGHRHPRFLPGGRELLYVVIRKDPGDLEHSIVARPLDGGAERLILRSPGAVDYASGYLLFLQGRTLLARPFDPQRLEFTGEQSVLSDRVHLISVASAASVFSASQNGMLVYKLADEEERVTLVRVDADGREEGALGAPADFRWLAWSPDGKSLAASQRYSDARTRDIWLYDLERDTSSRFTFEPGEEALPVWSHDGRTIFYSGEGKKDRAIYRKGLDGTDPVLVSDNEGVDDYPMAVSPDGRFLASVCDSRKTLLDIWLIPLQGGGKARPLLQTPTAEIPGTFSPDGRWFSYSSNESGTLQIYVTSFPDAGRKWQISKDSGIYPIWSRDGRSILYQTDGGQLRVIGIDTRGDTVKVGSERVLFSTRQPSPAFRSFAVDADLRKLVRMRFDTKVEPALHVVLNWPQTLRPNATP